jgi:hypothetical protein
VTHDELADLLGAYALHALDSDERAAVEEHLATCPRCRAEVLEHEQAAALLGNSGGTAPEGLWDRIADALEETPPPLRLPIGAAAEHAPVRRRPARRWVAVGVGLAAAAVIGVLGAQVVRQDHRIDRLQSTFAAQAPTRAFALALVTPGAHRARLTSTDGRLSVPAVVLPDGTGYLLTEGMPHLAKGETYQLWGQSGGHLLSLGVLGATPEQVVAFQAGDGTDALAITQERAPGVAQSANRPVVAGRLD